MSSSPADACGAAESWLQMNDGDQALNSGLRFEIFGLSGPSLAVGIYPGWRPADCRRARLEACGASESIPSWETLPKSSK